MNYCRYVDARLDATHMVPDMKTLQAALSQTATLQGDIWTEAVASTRLPVPIPMRPSCSSRR